MQLSLTYYPASGAIITGEIPDLCQPDGLSFRTGHLPLPLLFSFPRHSCINHVTRSQKRFKRVEYTYEVRQVHSIFDDVRFIASRSSEPESSDPPPPREKGSREFENRSTGSSITHDSTTPSRDRTINYSYFASKTGNPQSVPPWPRYLTNRLSLPFLFDCVRNSVNVDQMRSTSHVESGNLNLPGSRAYILQNVPNVFEFFRCCSAAVGARILNVHTL